MPGRRRASIVLPVPGGPASSRLCPPAAAISSARRARSWPRTSARSGTPAQHLEVVVGRRRLRRLVLAAQVGDGLAEVPHPDRLDAGERHLRCRLDRTDEMRQPCTPRSLRRDERPGHRAQAPVEPELAERCMPVERPRRHLVGRGEHGERDREVEPEPSLRSAAGARLIVIRVPGHSSSAAATLERTRAFASWHARSARPTIANAGMPVLDVRLDLDPARVDADERVRDGASEHVATLGDKASRVRHGFVPSSSKFIRGDAGAPAQSSTSSIERGRTVGVKCIAPAGTLHGIARTSNTPRAPPRRLP